MLVPFQQKRSARAYRGATNNLYLHTRKYLELKTLASEGLPMVSTGGDSFGHAELTAISRNIQANILAELHGAEILLESIVTAASTLKGHLHPSVALTTSPGALVAICGDIKEASRNLDVLAGETAIETKARATDIKAVLAEMQGLELDLQTVVRDLRGLQDTIQQKRFVSCSMADDFQKAVDTSVAYLRKKYLKPGVIYKVPQNAFGGN